MVGNKKLYRLLTCIQLKKHKLEQLKMKEHRECSRPVNEVFSLEVCHARCDLSCDVEQDGRTDFILLTGSQIIQEVSLAHKFSYYEKWGLECANT